MLTICYKYCKQLFGGRIIMNTKLYYLFSEISKNNFVESIYACEDGETIENATMQTGVYPMGTFLSKTINILDPLAKKNFSVLQWDMIISKELEIFSEEKKASSFSNLIYDNDAVAHKVFELLLLDNEKYVHSKRSKEEFTKILKLYLNYVRLCGCQDKGKYSSIKELYLLINQTRDRLPEHFTYVTNVLNKQNIATENEIENALVDIDFIDSAFAPPIKERNTLFPRPYSPLHNTIKTKWGELKTPLEVFDITDIIDLILASVYCIFQQGYFLKECRYCKSLFTTHDKRKNYCPNLNNDYSCSKESKRKKQSKREAPEWAKKEKCLRTTSARNYGVTSDEHRKNLDYCQKWRNEMKNGNITDAKYVELLERKYLKKYKNK